MAVEKEEQIRHHPDSILKIETLGQFMVKKNGRTLTSEVKSSKKIWTLFKYLLTYRNRGLLPEMILDHLYPDQSYDDPKNTLRTQMHRLRKLLGEQGESSCSQIIQYDNGCYSWNPNCLYQVDADLFETLSADAKALKSKKPDESIDLYRQALKHYRGDYLPEYAEEDWVIPHRIHYRRLFIENVLDLSRLLARQQDYASILEVCEKSMQLEPCEEAFHLVFLNTLLKTGRIRQALDHYEYVTSLNYRELGIAPSDALKQIYQEIQKLQETSVSSSEEIEWSKNTSSKNKAYFCHPFVFQSIVELEQRRSERGSRHYHICLFTLQNAKNDHQGKALPTAASILQKLLVDNLRRGDTLSRWSENQFVALLYGLADEQTSVVLDRLSTDFHQHTLNSGIRLTTSLEADLPKIELASIVD
jgi:DNA-binding SARP family transcriptional activator